MILDNVELFNVDEIENYNSGVLLERFPSWSRNELTDRGAWMSMSAHGCEIRFKTDAQAFWITLGAAALDVDVYVMCGDYFFDKYTIKSSEKITLQFQGDLFDNLDQEMLDEKRFSKNLWRFYFHSEGPAIYYGIKPLNGKIIPPSKEDEPQNKILAYGSSITHWCWTLDSRNSYIQQTAMRLGLDVYNKGMAGACFIEKNIADYLSSINDWEIAFLELGVNVYKTMNMDEFKKRVYYLLDAMTKKHPNKKIFITGIYDCYLTIKHYDDLKYEKYTEILKEAPIEFNNDNIIYINSKEILTSTEFLSRDFIHPSDYGHIMMGENLSKIIKKYIIA